MTRSTLSPSEGVICSAYADESEWTMLPSGRTPTRNGGSKTGLRARDWLAQGLAQPGGRDILRDVVRQIDLGRKIDVFNVAGWEPAFDYGVGNHLFTAEVHVHHGTRCGRGWGRTASRTHGDRGGAIEVPFEHAFATRVGKHAARVEARPHHAGERAVRVVKLVGAVSQVVDDGGSVPHYGESGRPVEFARSLAFRAELVHETLGMLKDLPSGRAPPEVRASKT